MDSNKPPKGELTMWATSNAGQYFAAELMKAFPLHAASYKHKTLEEHHAAAERAAIIEWIGKFCRQ